MLTINNRDKIDWQKDMVVNDILDAMGYEYSLITVTVNGELVPHEDFDSYKVPDNADVIVFHLAHGG